MGIVFSLNEILREKGCCLHKKRTTNEKNGLFKEMKNYHFFKTNNKKPNERLKIFQTNLKENYGFLLNAQILQKIKMLKC